MKVKALERMVAILSREARACVGDLQTPGSATTRTSPPEGVRRSAFSTRLETTWRTLSASAVAGAGPVGGDAERDAEGLGLLLIAAGRVVGDLGEVDLRRVDAEGGGIHAREIEQVADQPAEPLGLGGDRRRGVAGGDGAVVERLRVAGDRRSGVFSSWLTESRNAPLGFACAAQLLREIVERAGDRRQLGGALRGTGSGCGRRPAPRAAAATRATGRTMRRARNHGPPAASSPPASAAITSPSTYGRQLVFVRLFGRSRMNVRLPTGSAAK